MRTTVYKHESLILLEYHIEMLLLEVRHEDELLRVVLDGVGSVEGGRQFALFDFKCIEVHRTRQSARTFNDVTYTPRTTGPSFVLQDVRRRPGPKVEMFFGAQFGTITATWIEAAATIRRGATLRGGQDPVYVDADDGSEFSFLTSGDLPWMVTSS